MNVPDDQAIGDRLRQARAGARVTQAGAAAALGVPCSAVSALETGSRRLTAVELAKCAALYRRPAGWFLGDESGPARPPAELSCLIGALSRADQDTMTLFAEFLAARRAAAAWARPPRQTVSLLPRISGGVRTGPGRPAGAVRGYPDPASRHRGRHGGRKGRT